MWLGIKFLLNHQLSVQNDKSQNNVLALDVLDISECFIAVIKSR